MAETKDAKKVYTLDEIKFNEENKAMAVISALIPLVGLIMLFVEKKDLFVRYMGAQSTVLSVFVFATVILYAIPVINILMLFIGWIIYIGMTVLLILTAVKASKGERFDIPVVSDVALKVMGWF